MIVEIATLTAAAGLRDQLREALRAARAVLARFPGYRASTFHQGLEDADSFVLTIHWESRDAYLESFRDAALLAEWRGHFVHLLAAPPRVAPYETIAGP
ncbi:MAG TPA: antibiotic biosynthesis monooxygenase [Polyangia bacterium]|nr:antibiotic biosynthesis monooxygenase [Polyangia bacterium]